MTAIRLSRPADIVMPNRVAAARRSRRSFTFFSVVSAASPGGRIGQRC